MADERKTPSNYEAEQAVLGAVFYDQASIKTILDKLKTTDFFYLKNQAVYESMERLFKASKPIDVTTLTDDLRLNGKYEEVGGISYLTSLADATPSVANLMTYIDIVKDKSVQRDIIRVCNEIRDDCYNTTDVTNFIDDMEKKIFLTTRERRTGDLKPVIEVANEVVKNIEKTSQLKGDITGLDTGYTMLNRYTLGLQPSELVILAARPSMGKTALALNIALNVARNEDKPYVAFFSLEMGVEQLVMRLLSSISAINNNELKLGRLAGGDWKKLDYAVNSLSKINLLLDDSGTVNVADLRSKCRKMKSDGKLDLVIVDYLQLLSGSKNRGDNRVQEVSEISRTLKEIARELKIPVLALSQLSRTVETRPDKRPIMADLRESGSIEQDADIVLFLYRDDYYTKEKSTIPNTATVIIAKNRSGTTGDFNLLFHKETTTFTNLSSSEESYEE